MPSTVTCTGDAGDGLWSSAASWSNSETNPLNCGAVVTAAVLAEGSSLGMVRTPSTRGANGNTVLAWKKRAALPLPAGNLSVDSSAT